MASNRIKWRDRMPENDIKYGGYLSYRHLRIIGWVCLIIAQVAVILKLEVKLAPDTASVVDTWTTIISIFAGLPVPLFLLANFSTILQKRGDYKSLFIKFGGLALVMYILANFLVFHYGYRTLAAVNPSLNWGDAADLFGQLLPLFGKTGYTLNIFIDMLLVVLMFFFANYEPKTKAFEGKRVYLFRAMIILPVAYEVAAILIKYHIGMGNMTIPSPIFFLLPSKPPLIFAAFFVIVVGLKFSEWRYLRREGNTKEKFEQHILTRAHSLKISIGISVAFAIFAIADLALMIGLLFASYAQYAAIAGITPEEVELLAMNRMDVFENIGIGGSVGLILVIPLVMLFSYTKQHKNPKIDLIIPIAGVALIALVLIEGTFQVVTLNIGSFFEKLRQIINEYVNGESEGEPSAHLLISWVRNIHL